MSPAHIGDANAERLSGTVVNATAGAEAANAIPVVLQLQNNAGRPVQRVVRYHARMYDANMVESLVAAFTLDVSAGGTLIASSAVDQAAIVFETNALGQATVDVTDATGALAGTVNLELAPYDREGESKLVPLTFA